MTTRCRYPSPGPSVPDPEPERRVDTDPPCRVTRTRARGDPGWKRQTTPLTGGASRSGVRSLPPTNATASFCPRCGRQATDRSGDTLRHTTARRALPWLCSLGEADTQRFDRGPPPRRLATLELRCGSKRTRGGRRSDRIAVWVHMVVELVLLETSTTRWQAWSVPQPSPGGLCLSCHKFGLIGVRRS